MEGVGARLGRSSTRYGGPATVFSGPVRKWKKKWVPLTNATPTTTNHHHSNKSSPSNLVLYKWTPISKENTTTTADSPAGAEPQRKKFRYVPIAVIEEQKQEGGAKSDDENKPEDGGPAPQPSQTSGSEGKPDENEVKQENQITDGAPTEEANETSLDLNLGFKAHDGDSGTDQRMGEQDESSNQLERTTSGDVEMRPAAATEVESQKKRKAVTNDLDMGA